MHEVGTTSCRQNAAVTGKALPGELGDVHPQATAYPLLQFLGVGVTSRPAFRSVGCPFISRNFWPSDIGQSVKLRFPGIEHGYGKVIEVLDIPSR
jgi:hypothetical protein